MKRKRCQKDQGTLVNQIRMTVGQMGARRGRELACTMQTKTFPNTE